MTDHPEYLLDGEPLAACATNALGLELRLCLRGYELGRAPITAALMGASMDKLDRINALIAELETRKDWPEIAPYGGMCVL